jgi:OmcA/MtrC family decaheme c-type cytochrome
MWTSTFNPALGSATKDFRPDGNTTLTTRSLVATSSCNSCHNELRGHDGRTGVELCVTCHNATQADPGTGTASLVADPESGNVLDLRQMAHKIHMGRNLPSKEAGQPDYIIWGYGDSKHNFSEVGFPQEPLNCTKCHSSSAANAGNYATTPSIEACGACHDNIKLDGTNPTWGVAHGGGTVATSTGCSVAGSCHSSGQTNDATVAGKHKDTALTLTSNYNVTIQDASVSAHTVTVDFYVADSSGTNYDIMSDAKFTDSNARLSVLLGWSTKDYTNGGSGNAVGQPVSINAVTSASNIGGNVFRVTSALPEYVGGSGVASVEGRARDSSTGSGVNVPIRNKVKYYAIDDPGADARRDIVSVSAKCDNCHGTLSMHGGNRSDNGESCVICHNPNATDINRRPDDHTATGSLTADGKKEESIDFKRMIHGIHAAGKRENPLVVWGYGNTEHVFNEDEVTFPGILNRCDTCHVENSSGDDAFVLPLVKTVLGSTVNSDPAAAIKSQSTEATLDDSRDDFNITATSAVCSACHDTLLARAHMYQNGGRFSVTQGQIDAINPNNY